MRRRGPILITLGLALSIFSLMTYAGKNLSEFRSKTHDIYTVGTTPSKISLDGNIDDWSDFETFSGVEFPKENGSMMVFDEHAGGTWTGAETKPLLSKSFGILKLST